MKSQGLKRFSQKGCSCIGSIRRIESHPAAYLATAFKLYKKGDLLRSEKQDVATFNPTIRRRMIQIRNKEGIYTLMESESMPNDFALFMSYEEEKLNRSTVALMGQLKSYTIKKTGQKSVRLLMPTEYIRVTSADQSDRVDVQVTTSIAAPVGLFFDALQGIEGTPLQFTESQFGWLNRYTIESISAQSLPDALFQIDPKLRIITTEQMLKELSDFK